MSVTISGDTGLAGAATGALNGSLGATTPAAATVTTLTASGKINSGHVLFYDVSVASGGPVTITLPEGLNSVGALVACTGILQNTGGRVGLYLISGYLAQVSTITAIDVLTVTANASGTITLTSSNANQLQCRVKILL
jgi:hypothetical protein